MEENIESDWTKFEEYAKIVNHLNAEFLRFFFIFIRLW